MRKIITKSIIQLHFFLMILQLSSCMIGHMFSNDHRNSHGSDVIHDPVCGKVVNAATPYHFSYKEKTYFFDSEECIRVFEKNPERFIKTPKHMSNKDRGIAVIGAVAMTTMMIFVMGFLIMVR